MKAWRVPDATAYSVGEEPHRRTVLSGGGAAAAIAGNRKSAAQVMTMRVMLLAATDIDRGECCIIEIPERESRGSGVDNMDYRK